MTPPISKNNPGGSSGHRFPSADERAVAAETMVNTINTELTTFERHFSDDVQQMIHRYEDHHVEKERQEHSPAPLRIRKSSLAKLPSKAQPVSRKVMQDQAISSIMEEEEPTINGMSDISRPVLPPPRQSSKKLVTGDEQGSPEVVFRKRHRRSSAIIPLDISVAQLPARSPTPPIPERSARRPRVPKTVRETEVNHVDEPPNATVPRFCHRTDSLKAPAGVPVLGRCTSDIEVVAMKDLKAITGDLSSTHTESPPPEIADEVFFAGRKITTEKAERTLGLHVRESKTPKRTIRNAICQVLEGQGNRAGIQSSSILQNAIPSANRRSRTSVASKDSDQTIGSATPLLSDAKFVANTASSEPARLRRKPSMEPSRRSLRKTASTVFSRAVSIIGELPLRRTSSPVPQTNPQSSPLEVRLPSPFSADKILRRINVMMEEHSLPNPDALANRGKAKARTMYSIMPKVATQVTSTGSTTSGATSCAGGRRNSVAFLNRARSRREEITADAIREEAEAEEKDRKHWEQVENVEAEEELRRIKYAAERRRGKLAVVFGVDEGEVDRAAAELTQQGRIIRESRS